MGIYNISAKTTFKIFLNDLNKYTILFYFALCTLLNLLQCVSLVRFLSKPTAPFLPTYNNPLGTNYIQSSNTSGMRCEHLFSTIC